jgi:uncharacterized membrane protein YphA (DoxX/SURF4 family)
MQNQTPMENSETGTIERKSFTRFLPHIARVLMGIAFLIFGLNGFLNFIPAPKDMPQDILSVMGAMAKGGFFTVVSAAEVLVAVLLLINRFVPLALALIAPIIVGILTFHIALQPATIAPGLVVAALELYLAWSYRKAFGPMLAPKMSPGGR